MIDAAAAATTATTTTSNDRFDMHRRQIQCDLGLCCVTTANGQN